MSEFDVAIIGYGPTGMVLAGLLGQRGHRVVVLERYAGLYNLPRAACFDDEIMRVFQKLGLADAMGAGAVAQDTYDWVNAEGETLVQLQYDAVATGGWAALYMMFQPHVEAVLDGHDKALPTVDIRQGFTVGAIEQDDSGVVVRGTDAYGRQTHVRARFAVGADGGSGFVRRVVGTTAFDYQFEENWLVCDFHIRRPVQGLPAFRQVCDPGQPTSVVPIGPEHQRFSFMLKPDEPVERATEPAHVWPRVRQYLQEDDADLIRAVNYVFRSRIMKTWQQSRVFLAGDAAHEMPPFLGQGMCSGIRDSHNLAWKFDMVLRGLATEALLDTYQAEREPHVRFITEKAIELGRIQTLRDPDAARARDERLLAQRRANQAPAKLRLPGLQDGLVVNNGSVFPQATIRSGDRMMRFDDAVQPGWRLVVCDPTLVEQLTDRERKMWQAMGGSVAVIGSRQTAHLLADVHGTYSAWFSENACSAAIMRPDWYVYGTASDVGELGRLLGRLDHALKRGVTASKAA